MKILPWVLNAVVTGSGKEYNVALIIPDLKILQNVANELHLSVDPKALFDEKDVGGQKLKEILSLELQHHLAKMFGGYEIPKKFIFAPEDFTVENGMLTQTMKLKRRTVMEKYGKLLDSLY